MKHVLVAAVAVGTGIVCGCGQDRTKPAHATPTTAAPGEKNTPAGQPAAAPASQPADVAFQDKSGVRLQYPSGWKSQASDDFVLLLVPGDDPKSRRRIRLDVPDLPPHFPGMIRPGLVQNGYLNDLRKEHPDLNVEEAVDRNVPGASARLVRSAFQQNGQRYENVALIMIHADRVYILSMITDADQLSATRGVFDRVAASVRWTK